MSYEEIVSLTDNEIRTLASVPQTYGKLGMVITDLAKKYLDEADRMRVNILNAGELTDKYKNLRRILEKLESYKRNF